MKILLSFLFIGSCILMNSCDTETPEKAGIYYDSIVTKVNLLTGTYEGSLGNAIDDFDPKKMETAYSALEKYVASLDADFGKLTDFYGDNDLLTSANAVIRDYKKALPLYAKIVKNESLPQEEYTTENEKIFSDLSAEINTMLDKSVTEFQAATHAFGAKHKLTIVPSEK